MDRVTLSVLIGTYNRLPLLQKCVAALKKGVHVPHQVIMIDAGSVDGTLEFLEQCPQICLVKDDGLVGQARSLNRVLGSLNSDFVCWLSDDNIVVDGALDVAVDVLQRDPQIGMVALKIKDVTGPRTHVPYIGAIWESGILNCNQGMLPAGLLRQVGGFSEEFRDYGMDADLTTRVLLAGYKVVYTKKIAIHHYRNHDADNWTTKSNREQRLQFARDLYRSRYAALILEEKVPRSLEVSRSNTFHVSFVMGLYQKSVALYRTLLHSSEVFMNRAVVGKPLSTFFRDWYNASHGRFISRWDLLKNFFRSYYLVQQIPEALRKKFEVTENSTGNG